MTKPRWRVQAKESKKMRAKENERVAVTNGAKTERVMGR
jgi:hypothetical protein